MTAEELIEAWNRRGERYARRAALSRAELDSVMDNRRREIRLAPERDFAELRAEAALWYRKLGGEAR